MFGRKKQEPVIEDDKELEKLWELFKDSPEEIQSKRQEVTKIIQDNNLASFPSKISILTAFDELLSCFSVGGQVKHYYRYGSYTACEREREKFWFAMRNGSFSEKENAASIVTDKDLEKRRKIQDFFKKRLLEDKANGSSEDIWNIRKVPLARPFSEGDQK